MGQLFYQMYEMEDILEDKKENRTKKQSPPRKHNYSMNRKHLCILNLQTVCFTISRGILITYIEPMSAKRTKKHVPYNDV